LIARHDAYDRCAIVFDHHHDLASVVQDTEILSPAVVTFDDRVGVLDNIMHLTDHNLTLVHPLKRMLREDEVWHLAAATPPQRHE